MFFIIVKPSLVYPFSRKLPSLLVFINIVVDPDGPNEWHTASEIIVIASA
jgi:hypothetical protein